MAQKAVEIILMRQLAGYLALPMLLFDTEGNLLYFNEPAEALMGMRFEESVALTSSQWNPLIDATREDGQPIPTSERPLHIALRSHHPAHAVFWLRRSDGSRRKVEASALPLDGQGDRHLGALVTFWDVDTP